MTPVAIGDIQRTQGTRKTCIMPKNRYRHFLLGLHKAPRIKRQVASIDKKSDFRAKSGHLRTSTPNTASSSQKKQMTLKTVTSGKVHIPSPRMQSFEDTKIQGGNRATGVRPGRDVDISDGEQHSQEEPSATMERSRRHQNWVTRSIQDQIRKLQIV